MNRGRRFRYALEPVLRERRWERDALLAELGQQSAAIAREQEALAALRGQAVALSDQWTGRAAAAGALPVDSFARVTRYLSQLAGQARAKDAELTRLAAGRDALVERMVPAQRALDAIERHRDRMHGLFVRLDQSGEFKLADDRWNTLQAKDGGYGDAP
jgi:uncharacterized protein YhaN